MIEMKQTSYHSFLRMSALVLVLLLVFYGGYISPITKQLSNNTQQYVANVVGVGASVLPTELNQLTAEITARQRELDARESALTEREISVGLTEPDGTKKPETDITMYILSVLLFIILVLIVLNYALDFARERHYRSVSHYQ